ncbi:hypothetical protein IFM89_019690 [Coptis chinensis]|uniref:Uncharacterized protein n=1 Tax=Coptis chinensis TaxID=261450 RepID=A0A835LQR6_9MAGN|nr:hypothetical protein IFM89_019690 [Coptis chinensis]
MFFYYRDNQSYIVTKGSIRRLAIQLSKFCFCAIGVRLLLTGLLRTRAEKWMEDNECTRKLEIGTVLVEATKNAADDELEVDLSNRDLSTFYKAIKSYMVGQLRDSTRKSEIVTVLVEATKNAADDELKVDFSNRFQYHAAAELVKEFQFEEVEGGIRTRRAKK